MDEIMKLLGGGTVFFIASVEGDKARVRPFSFIMDFEGKLYFCTNNQKKVYKQLNANPNLEISAMVEGGKWIRLNGKAVFDGNLAAKKKTFEIMPSLANIYQTPENPIFEVFYLKDPKATVYSMTAQPEEITL